MFINGSPFINPDTITVDPVTGVESGDPYLDPAPGYGGLTENNLQLETVMATLQKLDYCIPGPRPGWEESATFKTQEILADFRQDLDSNAGLNFFSSIPIVGSSFTEKKEKLVNLNNIKQPRNN